MIDSTTVLPRHSMKTKAKAATDARNRDRIRVVAVMKTELKMNNPIGAR